MATATEIQKGRRYRIGQFSTSDSRFFDVKGHVLNEPRDAVNRLMSDPQNLGLPAGEDFSIGAAHKMNPTVDPFVNMYVQYVRIDDPYASDCTIVEVYYSSLITSFGGPGNLELGGVVFGQTEYLDISEFYVRDVTTFPIWEEVEEKLPRRVKFRTQRELATSIGEARDRINELEEFSNYLWEFPGATYGNSTPGGTGTGAVGGTNPETFFYQYSGSHLERISTASNYYLTHTFRHDCEIIGENRTAGGSTPILRTGTYPTPPGSPPIGYWLPIPYVPPFGGLKYQLGSGEGPTPKYWVVMPQHRGVVLGSAVF